MKIYTNSYFVNQQFYLIVRIYHNMPRILIYNIAYGSGAPSSSSANILQIHRYFKRSDKNLKKISKFIEFSKADIVGLIEVDTGSFRTAKRNQALEISKDSCHHTHYLTKYGESFTGKIVPILRKQGNAILTRDESSNGIYHYFPGGFKKLIIELEMENLRVFLLHLSLSKRARRMQLRHMSNLLSTKKCPVIIAGDFNAFKGTSELDEIQKSLNLVNPNVNHLPTYPAWKPKHQLDFILCSKEIKINNFEIPKVHLSDHLPIIMDFEI